MCWCSDKKYIPVERTAETDKVLFDLIERRLGTKVTDNNILKVSEVRKCKHDNYNFDVEFWTKRNKVIIDGKELQLYTIYSYAEYSTDGPFCHGSSHIIAVPVEEKK